VKAKPPTLLCGAERAGILWRPRFLSNAANEPSEGQQEVCKISVLVRNKGGLPLQQKTGKTTLVDQIRGMAKSYDPGRLRVLFMKKGLFPFIKMKGKFCGVKKNLPAKNAHL